MLTTEERNKLHNDIELLQRTVFETLDKVEVVFNALHKLPWWRLIKRYKLLRQSGVLLDKSKKLTKESQVLIDTLYTMESD